MKGDEEFMVSNKVSISVKGGIAELRHFPLDIAVCINDLDRDSDEYCRRGGNRYKNLGVRWKYLVKRLDHDCDLILRLTTSRLQKICPYYTDWRNDEEIGPEEFEIFGQRIWTIGSAGLILRGTDDDIKLDTLEVEDSFEFVQALMMDQQVLLEEISKYGESYKQSRLASGGN